MQNHFLEFFYSVTAVAAGGFIGGAFGFLQTVALRRHERQQQTNGLKNGWTLFPGSGARIAYLLIALALVQLICPMLFVDGTQWLVSAGVLLGYGWLLFLQLRRRLRNQSN
jgi:hypothetical protein